MSSLCAISFQAHNVLIRSPTVTSIATATAAAYQYSLLYDQDNCAITPAHIVDYSMPGVTEQQAIDNCMQTCTGMFHSPGDIPKL